MKKRSDERKSSYFALCCFCGSPVLSPPLAAEKYKQKLGCGISLRVSLLPPPRVCAAWLVGCGSRHSGESLLRSLGWSAVPWPWVPFGVPSCQALKPEASEGSERGGEGTGLHIHLRGDAALRDSPVTTRTEGFTASVPRRCHLGPCLSSDGIAFAVIPQEACLCDGSLGHLWRPNPVRFSVGHREFSECRHPRTQTGACALRVVAGLVWIPPGRPL